MAELVTIPDQEIIEKIYFIRNKKVMLDNDLAELYQVSTGNLNKAVKRNIKRFPDDFMFQLTKAEFDDLKFQNGISSWGGTRKQPYAFTEQGLAMLSGVLNSDIAIAVNIQIIRIFTKMREMIFSNKEILIRLEKLEIKLFKHDEKSNKQEKDIQLLFQALKQLLNQQKLPRKQIGYKLKKGA